MARGLAEAGADIIGVSASMEADAVSSSGGYERAGASSPARGRLREPEDVRRLAQLLNDLARGGRPGQQRRHNRARTRGRAHDEDWDRVLQVT